MKPIVALLVGVFALSGSVSYGAAAGAPKKFEPKVLDLATSKAKLKNTMNYKDCLNYSVKPCVQMCPGGFLRPPYPTVGVRFTYQEPTALAETSCLRGETNLGGGFITKMMAGGALKAPDDQKCAEGIKSPGTQITRHYNDVHIYGFSGPTRYLSSGNPLQVTQSLTCGIAGAAGLFMDFSKMAGGFQNLSMKNIGNQIKQMPQKLTQQVQNSIQKISQFPAKIGDGLNSMVNNTIKGIEDMAAGVQNSLNQVERTLNNLGDIGTDLANIGSRLEQMGNEFAADAVAKISGPLEQLSNLQTLDLSTLSDLQALDMGALTQYAGELGTALEGVPGMGQIGGSLQTLGALDTAQWQTGLANAKEALKASGKKSVSLNKGVAEQLASDTAREEVSARQSLLASAGYSGDSRFSQPAILSSFAPVGDVPEVEERGGRLHPTGRLLNSGTSQVAAEALEREHRVTIDKLNFYGKEALRIADLVARGGDNQNACFMLDMLSTGEQEVQDRLKEVRQEFEVFAKASYLPLEHTQKRAKNELEPSCVRTHAGYMLKPKLGVGMGTERINNINCVQICDDDQDGNDKNCYWEVKSGFKGSCAGNRLSQFEVDGLYPACEDDRKKLNSRRKDELMKTLARVEKEISQAERRLKGYVQQQGVACKMQKSDAGHSKPAAESTLLLATAPVESYGLSAQLITQNAPVAALEGGVNSVQTIGGAGGISSGGSSGGLGGGSGAGRAAAGTAGAAGGSQTDLEVAEFGGLTNTMNTISAFTRKGGARQGINNMIGKRLPFGLYPAFISESTNWSEPPKMDFIGQIKMAIGSVTQSAMAPFLCMAPTYASDYGITSGKSLAKMNKLANCVGTWGAEHPSTGWSHHKDPTKSAMLVAYRGHAEAVKFGGIQGNTKGTQQFNLDYPFIKDSGKHRGSGCYNVGTGKNIQGNNLLKPNFANAGKGTADIADGKHVATMWKNTSCCVYFCTGFLGLFPKPKVKRYY